METILAKMIQDAPTVAVLLVLLWRIDKRMDDFFALCLRHLMADADDEQK